MKKKIKSLILLKIIMIIFIIYVYRVDGKEIFLGGFEKQMTLILGGIRYFVIPFLLLSIFSDFMVNTKKQLVFKTRLVFLFIFLLGVINLEFLYKVENFSDNLEKSIFMYFFLEKNIGLFFTMIFYNFYYLVPLNINILVTGIVLFLSGFILFGKVFGAVIRSILSYYSKENILARKTRKKLIKEKSRIRKEILEKEKKEEINLKKELIKEKQQKKQQEKQREEKIIKLKDIKIKEKQIKTGEQLKFKNIKIEKNIVVKEKNEKEEEKQIEKVAQGQLNFEFENKKEEVK